jgi:geranylgeranyl pyrophosphate synthase
MSSPIIDISSITAPYYMVGFSSSFLKTPGKSSCLTFGKKHASVSDLKEAVRTVSNIGIDKEIRMAARTHIEKAVQSLADYADSRPKRALESSAFFIVERRL